ncbi:hypothetical protein NC653_013349 [Populus alba x Populus x berolinensis]|uniref:Uncharacterized protein n=1 Tax=Populus alba x Populus x berolinensis TaxID=444605 RepID=A0AAD6W3F1_9ROSI|nr:hypothetical protein NC653_013349 [Populus alba x Populus x berolinensis]
MYHVLYPSQQTLRYFIHKKVSSVVTLLWFFVKSSATNQPRNIEPAGLLKTKPSKGAAAGPPISRFECQKSLHFEKCWTRTVQFMINMSIP